MGTFLPITTLAAILVMVGGGCSYAKPDRPRATEPVPSSQQIEVSFGVPAALIFGQSVRYADGLRVRLETIDDSRCPTGAVCVWEGELAPLLRLDGGSLATEQEVRLGTARAVESTIGNYAIALREATPSTATIVVTEREPTAGCRRTGCSGAACSDQEITSSCIYRPEYDCYRTATCERQADGNCGWTQTRALDSCLAASRNADPSR